MAGDETEPAAEGAPEQPAPEPAPEEAAPPEPETIPDQPEPQPEPEPVPAEDTPEPPPAQPTAPTPAAPAPPPPPDRVSLWGATVFGILLLLVGALLIYLLIKIWPAVPHGASAGKKAAGGGGGATTTGPRIDLFPGHIDVEFHLIADTALIVLAATMGGIGSCVFIAISFGDYVGNRRFVRSWVWFYIVRIFIGPALAVIFYFALRAGFLATSTAKANDINPYGVAAISGLIGLFSKQAGDKLHQVFDALFQVDDRYGDAARSDSVTNPVPAISGIDPPMMAGAENLTFRLEGTGFVTDSTVSVSRTADSSTMIPRTAAYVDGTHLDVTLDAEDVLESGTLYFSVFNPEPGGGTSETKAFPVS